MIYMEFPKDCKIIQEYLLTQYHYASLPECQAIWQDYSKGFDASWMILPKTKEELSECLAIYIP